MTAPGFYLCGCFPADKIQQYREMRFDEFGLEICPEHGTRLYGWASSPDKNHSRHNKPLKLENIDNIKSPDNRDPVLVYAMMKAVEEDASEDIARTNGSPGITEL